MVVQHNLIAMNSNRMLNSVTKNQGKSTEKLSSGYRINRAADDAAGLSISEKMRKQIRGLTQASANAQDGISMVQVADGALSETTDILQRINELSVKAANGTLSDDDRGYIQNEVDQLLAEVDRIATTTTFNESIHPLLGVEVQTGLYSLDDFEEFTQKVVNGTGADLTFDGKAWNQGDTSSATMVQLYEKGNINKWLQRYDGAASQGSLKTTDPIVTYSTGKFLNGSYSLRLDDIKADEEGRLYFTSKRDSKNYYFLYRSNENDTDYGEITLYDGTYLSADFANVTAKNVKYEGLSLRIQAGADATAANGIYVETRDARAKALGIDKIDVSTAKGALKAIDLVSEAISTVSSYRSYFGATQNRLDHTINNLDNVVENTTAAESQIRDTDMAKEMVAFSNNNILAQAGQAMLAQANQSNQGVLSLLS